MVAVCVLVAHPQVDMGVNDDWSYIWSAKVLAETGRMTYNGWGAHLLGWQMVVGAAAIRLLGFSFTHVRLAGLLVALLTVALLQRVLVRLGLGEWNSTLATLTLCLSPIFLPLAFSFMSEIPGALCILVCLYACIRAMEAGTDRRAVGWILFAASTNVILGSARQVDWLGLLVMVPATACFLRGRQGVLRWGLAAWLAGAAVIAAAAHWLSVQPYAVVEPLIGLGETPHKVSHVAIGLVRALLAALIFLFPVLAGFPANAARWNSQARRVGLVVSLTLGAAWALLWVRHSDAALAFSSGDFIGNYLGRFGLLQIPGVLGRRPEEFSHSARLGLTMLTTGALLGFLLVAWLQAPTTHRVPEKGLRTDAVFWLLGPYAAVYLLLLATRANIYDRYLLPLLIMALVPLVRLYQQRLAARLPWATAVLVLGMGAWTTAALHDQGVEYRARLAAIAELRAAGVERNALYTSLEYDGWTELEQAGFVNDRHIRRPAGAYRKIPDEVLDRLPAECRPFIAPWTPGIAARYLLTSEPLGCYQPTQFAPVPYRTWLAPHQRQVMVEAARE